MTESMFPDELAPVVITIDAQIACVARELKLRRNVYKRRVGAGFMTQKLADKEMARMEAVLLTLARVKAQAGTTRIDG